MLPTSAPTTVSPNPQTSISESAVGPRLNEAKRKRRALSCFHCRRRKLRCNREYPSCSRCQTAGHADSCRYDERTIPSRHAEPSAPPLFRHNTSIPQVLSDWSANTAAPARQTSPTENRLSGLEASQTPGTWQILGRVSTAITTSEQQPDPNAGNNILTSPREVTPMETIIFRGENFKTQYYGGSNPTSLMALVGRPALFHIYEINNLSFQNFDPS